MILMWLSALLFFWSRARAQVPGVLLKLRLACLRRSNSPGGGAQGPGVAGQGRQGGGQAQSSLRNVNITAIPGVVAAGRKWTKVWQAGGNSADGIIPNNDGSVLVAQEDYDRVLEIDADGKASVFVANAKRVGSLSMDRQGRLYGAHRTERPGSRHAPF